MEGAYVRIKNPENYLCLFVDKVLFNALDALLKVYGFVYNYISNFFFVLIPILCLKYDYRLHSIRLIFGCNDKIKVTIT